MKRLLFLLIMMQFTQLGYAACNATLTNTKDYTIQSDSLMLGGEESAIITNGFTDAN
ncbi:fimbrial assembly protein, partial [Salmonella enterica]|nr:fimbrial assembly protein [Salmonella enterica]EDC5833696.1 fimbrial assembly protein [Salmonella enterica]